MRILITGGFGYIGGRLASHLSTINKNQITIGTRQPDVELITPGHTQVIQIDWHDKTSLESICSNVDIVIHAAGINSSDCDNNPIEALEFNGIGTESLVRAARKMGVKKFIYLSTAHVYAKPLVGLMHEEVEPSNQHPYATSHLYGEQAVLRETREGVMGGTIMRLSNVFGAPAHLKTKCWELVTNDLARQAIKNYQMVLKTDGKQQRDFIAMKEVCRITELLIMMKKSMSNGIFNVGSGKSISLKSMAKLIQEQCVANYGYKPKIMEDEDLVGLEDSKLIYQIKKMEGLNIKISQSSIIEELSQLLEFCKKNHDF